MIRKEEFCDIINELKSFENMRNDINKIFKKSKNSLVKDFCDSSTILIGNNDIVIKLLNNIFNLEEKSLSGTILDWWIYDINFGENFNKGDIVDNGKKIDLSTPEKLYDYFISIKK